MCGIAGWLAGSDPRLGEAALTAMGAAIAHRGPDGEGMCLFRGVARGRDVALAHRRLAIIDPEGAAQPMRDLQAGLALVFNGEIYNFRELREQLTRAGYSFTRDSDTEVLLRAYQFWGLEVVEHLRGMFAFALWDAGHGRLLLARDRFGEKPLYIREDARGLFFASEIKALLAVPGITAQVDAEAVRRYLAFRYVPGPRTLFAGIRKLPPATMAVWERGEWRERRYWVPPDRDRPRQRRAGSSRRDLVDAFLAQLEEAVSLQMVSDVPFGAFLSGGLDSSTVVALMGRHTRRVKTFSVGFRESRYSELGYAGVVAKHLGTEHHEIEVDPSDIVARLPRLVAYRDAPVAEPSDIPIHMLATEAAKRVKMVLTGEGSDELLGGYPKHVMERYAGAWQRLPAALRRGVIAPFARALPYGFRRVKTAIANLEVENWQDRQPRWFGAMTLAEADAFLNKECFRRGGNGGEELPPCSLAVDLNPPFDAAEGNTALRRILYWDQTSWLPDNLLERGDRMTMAASIESRVPFLDHRLAEFVSTLPDEWRVGAGTTKRILREAARRLLPERILSRPKVGFRVPVNEWFRGEMREFLLDHLLGDGSITRAWCEPHALESRIREHLDGRHNHEKLLWSLLNLDIWHRLYRPGMGAPPAARPGAAPPAVRPDLLRVA